LEVTVSRHCAKVESITNMTHTGVNSSHECQDAAIGIPSILAGDGGVAWALSRLGWTSISSLPVVVV
jgi:hypothetical protein